MICDKCNKEVCGVISHEFGYNQICMDCYHKLVDQRDMKSLDELDDYEGVIKTLNAEQIVKNFIEVFSQYQKNPSKRLYDILWRIRCWACHEDHTASTTIHEIMRWQKFDFLTEEERLENGYYEKKS